MIAFLGFIATVFAANWAITHVGLIPVGFGFAAPAGVAFAGLALVLRDIIQETKGQKWVLAAIALGAGASACLSGPLALASGTAFALSELADYAVYTPLRERGRIGAMLASNAVGMVVDSALFLSLAFGSLTYLPGQLLGKGWVTLVVVGAYAGLSRGRDLRTV